MKTLALALITTTAVLAQPSLEERLLATIPADHDERRMEHDPDGNPVEMGGAIVAWAPDGSRAAWIGSGNNRRFPVIDGVKGEDTMFADGIVFSADGKHVAWRAGSRTKDDKAERWWIGLDGGKLVERDLVGYPRFSPDGSRVAYWANEGAKIGRQEEYVGGTWWVEDHGKRLPPTFADCNWFTPPAFSPDGKWLAYVGSPKAQTYAAVAFGKATEGYGMADTPTYASDGKQVAWGALKDGRWTIWHNGKPVGKEHEHAGVPVFAPNGKALAYIAVSKGRKSVIMAGKKLGGDWDGIAAPVWSPDGKSVAFAANRGGQGFGPPGMRGTASDPNLLDREETGVTGGAWHAVIGGKAGEAWDLVNRVAWSPDSRSVAYCVRKGTKWRVIAGAARSEEFDEVGGPQWSEDGTKVAFGARAGVELWWKVLAVGK